MTGDVDDDDAEELSDLIGGNADAPWMCTHRLDEIAREPDCEFVPSADWLSDLLQERVREPEDLADGQG